MTAIRRLSFSGALLPAVLLSQSLVSTAPLPCTALLEEFTALNCGNCPGAHTMPNALATTYGDDLTIIGVHGGGLAVPSGSQPDFRTTAGTALWSQFNVTYQPQGMVDRQGLQQASAWNASIASVLAQLSPVNIGVLSTYNATLQELTVEVELYYTGEGPVGEDRIYVALKEDHIVGYQQDYVNGTQPDNDHRHVLRAYLTPIDGDVASTTSTGTFVSRTYALTIPATWNLAELDVVAFAGETNGVIHQVRSVDADGGMTVGVEETADRFRGLGVAYPVPATDQISIPLSTAVADEFLVVRDGLGRTVHQQRISPGLTMMQVPLNGLVDGVYTYGFSNGTARLVVVAR